MMRNLSNANGRGVAKASHDNMIASDMSNYTRTIAHSYVKVAESHLHGSMPSIVIVRFAPLYVSLALYLIILDFFSALRGWFRLCEGPRTEP
jgi:hypothetical protein